MFGCFFSNRQSFSIIKIHTKQKLGRGKLGQAFKWLLLVELLLYYMGRNPFGDNVNYCFVITVYCYRTVNLSMFLNFDFGNYFFNIESIVFRFVSVRRRFCSNIFFSVQYFSVKVSSSEPKLVTKYCRGGLARSSSPPRTSGTPSTLWSPSPPSLPYLGCCCWATEQ